METATDLCHLQLWRIKTGVLEFDATLWMESFPVMCCGAESCWALWESQKQPLSFAATYSHPASPPSPVLHIYAPHILRVVLIPSSFRLISFLSFAFSVLLFPLLSAPPFTLSSSSGKWSASWLFISIPCSLTLSLQFSVKCILPLSLFSLWPGSVGSCWKAWCCSR